MYVTVDERVPMLIMAIKLWAKKNNVYDAHLGLLSSYSWTLMVINYLQCMYSVETILFVTIIGYYIEWFYIGENCILLLPRWLFPTSPTLPAARLSGKLFLLTHSCVYLQIIHSKFEVFLIIVVFNTGSVRWHSCSIRPRKKRNSCKILI